MIKYIVVIGVSLFVSCGQAIIEKDHPPVVTTMYPSSDTLPENLLRIYVQFSKPMKTFGNLEHIKLVDDEGNEVVGAIFNNTNELWDSQQQQLTLLFDPSRVKTGLAINESMGRALQAGSVYKLIISDLVDITHEKMTDIFVKQFFVDQADLTPPEIDSWKTEIPDPGTREPFCVKFPASLDQLSLRQRLIVTNAKQERIVGETVIGNQEKVWKFIPDEDWKEGGYFLYINARLEDPSGNNLNGLFDHPIGSLKYDQEGETLSIPFSIGQYD